MLRFENRDSCYRPGHRQSWNWSARFSFPQNAQNLRFTVPSLLHHLVLLSLFREPLRTKTLNWSGPGPDCTQEGHPDPNHPGVMISDRYTDACPEAMGSIDPLRDAAHLDEKYGIAGALKCADNADDYLRKNTNYEFKWDDGLLDSKFESYMKTVKATGVLTLNSSRVSIQNKFGAYQRIILSCDFDTQRQEIVGYNLEPR